MSEPSTPPAPPAPVLAAGGRIIMQAQSAKFFLRVGSAAALARLLTPDDYGLFSMASVVFGLLYMTRDFGIVLALQQPDETGARLARLRQLGWIGGGVLALLGVLVGWPAAWLYSEPRLPPVLAAMSIGFVFCGGSAPALGLLHREQRIATIVRSEVIALALSTLTALLAAWQGAGVWSLVLLSVVNDSAYAGLMWWQSPAAPVARPGAALVSWREVLGFSANLTGHGFTSYFARTSDQMVVGWAAGAAPLGLYGRGAQIAALPMQMGLAPFSAWIMASLARLRVNPGAYRLFFRRAVNGFLHVSLAVGATCFVFPDLVVRAFFGERWMASVPVLHWLALGMAVQPLIFAPGWLLGSTGQVRLLLRLSLLWLALVLTACLLASRHGIEAVALAGALATVLSSILSLALCAGRTAVTAADILGACRRPLLCHGGWLLLAGLARWQFEISPGPAGWAMLAGLAALYYGILLAINQGLRRDIFGHLLFTR